MEKLKEFLNITNHIGYGYGYGYGSGDGSGYGYGDGSGYGSGDGSGYGYGDGLSSFNNKPIHIIDNLQTIIINIKNNVASGFILNKDFTTTPCYIIKEQNTFAHGKTIKEAMNSLQEKLFQDISIEERIEKFKQSFSDFSKKYKAIDLFSWHNKLTGSCLFGREAFCKEHNINIKKDKMTIYEFIELTKNSYGSDIIRQLI